MNNRQCASMSQNLQEMVKCEPYVRLACIPVKNFYGKKSDDPCAPQDHLDLTLTACYDHHRQWWAPRAQVVHQCATYSLYPWGRVQARVCRMKSMPGNGNHFASYSNSIQDPVMANHEPYRNDISHMDCSVASPHISNTNRGFARPNQDGLFYNS